MKQILLKNDFYSSTSYDDLDNKPQINDVEIAGEVSLEDLSTYSKEEIDKIADSTNKIVVAAEKPNIDEVEDGTIYYVGTEPPYNIYRYDLNATTGVMKESFLGSTSTGYNTLQKTLDPDILYSTIYVPGSISSLAVQKMDKESDELKTEDKTVVGSINELYNDKLGKQPKTDEGLKTESKDVVTAINSIANASGFGVDRGIIINENGAFAHAKDVGPNLILDKSSTIWKSQIKLPKITIDKYGHITDYTKKEIDVYDDASSCFSVWIKFRFDDNGTKLLDEGYATWFSRTGSAMEYQSNVSKSLYDESITIPFVGFRTCAVRAMPGNKNKLQFYYVAKQKWVDVYEFAAIYGITQRFCQDAGMFDLDELIMYLVRPEKTE